MKIITRAQAKAEGLKRYFTGEPCSQGHVCERRVTNYDCIECSKIRTKKEYVKTGFPRGRPRKDEDRPPSPNAIKRAIYYRRRLERDPEWRQTLNAYFRKWYNKRKENKS